jgi:predicted nuclease with TOPRIM domain
MFNLFKNKELNDEKAHYKALSEKLQDEVNHLRDRLDYIYQETKDADFVFDFKNMRVFSIERQWHKDQPCTIIGFIISEPIVHEEMICTKDVVKEWYYYCSKDQHVKLVEQYNKVMGKK